MTADLQYVVVLTVSAPRGKRPKNYLPVAPGLDWGKGHAEFCGDGWIEYRVESVLTQDQLDRVAQQTWMNIDDDDSGILRPAAFPRHVVPASVWYGETWYDTTAYRFYICPFPAGLRNHDDYRFGKFEKHTAWMKVHYRQLIKSMHEAQRQNMNGMRS